MTTQEKQLEILKLLFGNCVEEYTSIISIGCLSNGVMKEMKYPTYNIERISELRYSRWCDYYITANTTRVNRPRTKFELFALHNICIDIDLHSSDDNINDVANSLEYFLMEDLEIPIPNIFVRTGRGVQLWWHFEETSSKLLFMYQALVQMIIDRLNEIISAVETLSNLKVDTSASRNVVGYFRLPFTVNTKSNTMATADILTNETYNIAEMFDDYCKYENVRFIQDINVKKTSKDDIDKRYQSLIFKRKKFLEDYSANRNYNVTGSRDLVMFLYCVNLIQIVNIDFVMVAMKKLNSQFSEPLEQSKLDEILGYMQRKGVLKFRNETFLSFLPFSAEERSRYLTVKAHNGTRDEERKHKKEERNRRILEMATEGKTTEQIADNVGCSDKTVRTFLKSQGFSYSEVIKEQAIKLRNQGMTTKCIAEKLNLPERTIKRYCQKKEEKDH